MKKRILFGMIVTSLLFLFGSAVFDAQAQPLTDGCAGGPFDEKGDARPQSQCECSNDPAEAAFCLNATEYLVVALQTQVRVWLLSAQKTITQFYWLIARLIANLSEAMMSNSTWAWIRDSFLNYLQNTVGGSGGRLATLVQGSQGLFAIALMLAGLVMTFPFLGSLRLVQVERVIIWGVVLMALFISSAQGFDLINAIEEMRIWTMETIAGAGNIGEEFSPTDGLLMIIAAPFEASLEETRAIDLDELFTLPASYERNYFPGIQEEDYKKIRVLGGSVAGIDKLELIFAGQYLKTKPVDVAAEQQAIAHQGLWRMMLGLFSGYALLLFAVLFLVLAVVSLLLVLFFVAALPLGFFEFGAQILSQLFRQYLSLFAVSLLAGALVGFLNVITVQIADQGSSGDRYVLFIVSLLLVILLLTKAIQAAWKLGDASFNVVTNSVQAVVSAAGGNTAPGLASQGAEGGKKALGTAVTMAAAAATGGVAGGLMMAASAGTGAMLQGSSMGRQAVQLAATVAPDSPAVQMASTAAYSRGTVNTAMRVHGVAARTRHNQAAPSPAPTALQQAEQTAQLPGPILVGGSGQKAIRQEQIWQRLEEGLGTQGAQRVYQRFEQNGPGEIVRARQIVDVTQKALGKVELPFTAWGEPSLKLKQTVMRDLEKAGVVDWRGNPDEARYVWATAFDSIRRVQVLGQSPDGAKHLARAVLGEPPEARSLQSGDVSAQQALGEMAGRYQWHENDLSALFEAIRRGVEAGHKNGSGLVREISKTLQDHPAFRDLSAPEREKAAGLAALISQDAVIYQPVAVDADGLTGPDDPEFQSQYDPKPEHPGPENEERKKQMARRLSDDSPQPGAEAPDVPEMEPLVPVGIPPAMDPELIRKAVENALQSVFPDNLQMQPQMLNNLVQNALNEAMLFSADSVMLDSEALTRSVAQAVKIPELNTVELARQFGEAVQKALIVANATNAGKTQPMETTPMPPKATQEYR